eukprot:c7952_g1_i3.p1 GENE.c7952_g1_i3~~c7952_g1_i3.p1  ORF type:complete len:382 (-),score=106.97 c7952_g1_i3:620-1765(-)
MRSDLVNTSDRSFLHLFEYQCHTKLMEHPWVVIALLGQVTEQTKCQLTAVVQLDLNICSVDNIQLHASNLIEKIIQSALIRSDTPIEPPSKRSRMEDTQMQSLISLQSLPPTAIAPIAPATQPDLVAQSQANAHQSIQSGVTPPAAAAAAPERVGQTFDRFGRIMWTDALHHMFLEAIEKFGLYGARPKMIQSHMKIAGLTVEHIKSHLQMYRTSVKQVAKRRCAEGISVQITRGMTNTDLTHRIIESNCHNESELLQFIEQLILSGATTATPNVVLAPPPPPQMALPAPPHFPSNVNVKVQDVPVHTAQPSFVPPQPAQSELIAHLKATTWAMQGQINDLNAKVHRLQSFLQQIGVHLPDNIAEPLPQLTPHGEDFDSAF